MIAGDNKGREIQYSELMNYLPHRYPFVLIDRVIDFEISKWIKGIKNISSSESFLKSTNDQLEYSAALASESVGQLAAVLFSLTLGHERTPRFILRSIGRIGIHGKAYAGDQLQIQVELTNLMSDSVIINGNVETPRGKMIEIESMITAIR